MTTVLYLQTLEHGCWVNTAYDDSHAALDLLEIRSRHFDRNWGRQHAWRIVSLDNWPETVTVHWQNDRARLWTEAHAQVEAKRQRDATRTGTVEAAEDRLLATVLYFTVTVKDGRMRGSLQVSTYLEALALRDRLAQPEALVYAVGANGRGTLITDRLHRRLTAEPENLENEHERVDQAAP